MADGVFYRGVFECILGKARATPKGSELPVISENNGRVVSSNVLHNDFLATILT